MKPEELTLFMQSMNMGAKDLAEFLGVTPQGVKLWLNGGRSIPTTTVRLIRLFQRHPETISKYREVNL